MENNLRSCGECTACCDGHIIGNAYGHDFGLGKKCFYLVQQKCTIYETRPEVCRKYQCAWTQGLLPEEHRPDKTGLMVSVENDQTGKQYLKGIEIQPIVPYSIHKTAETFCTENNTYYVIIPYDSGHPQLPNAL